MKFFTPAALGLAIVMATALPVNASSPPVSVAYDSCPSPVQEPPFLRMIGSLETAIMTMLGLNAGGCSS